MGGGDATTFQCIPSLCARLKDVEPSTYVEWEPHAESRAFRRIFVCPSACGKSFPFMRPHVGLDACHSKNQKYPTFIMLVACMDGNNTLIAFGMVDKENEDNWNWFLNHLRRFVTGIQASHVQFVSDRCKGIINAIRNNFPGQSHVHCTIHLQRNVKKRFGVQMEKLFKVLHRCKSEEWYKQVLQTIKDQNQACWEYLEVINPTVYVMFAIPHPRFGHTTSNIVEIANNCILPIRGFGLLRLCIELYLYIMEKKAKQHQLAMDMADGELTPYARKHMTTEEFEAGMYRVRVASLNEALVQSSREEFIVTLQSTASCTCLVYRDMLLPCSHIIAFDREIRMSNERHVAQMWLCNYFQRAHMETLRPIDTSHLLTSPSCMAPPPMLRRGRRHGRRIAGPGEVSNIRSRQVTSPAIMPLESLLSTAPTHRSGGRLCSICREPGHDRRTCGRQRVPERSADQSREISHPDDDRT
ncbi:hypothetical protein R1sor_010052 [Riccia sorocarpa]|uniref:SWIM-type domain-containing protein n=1 Tax=Riccia sorocarpa TaxID=122646 RepID=A0ABD3HYI5_9MARC